jgi:cob(I)alamin adenosyltransferase
MMRRPGLQNEAPVAIGAFHKDLVAHFQIDLGVAQGAAAAVTGDAGGVGFASRIYTKTGDSGETGLGDGSRISKASWRVRAIGAVDETNAAIGIARLDCESDADQMLTRIQNDLFDLGADLCAPEDGRKAEERLRICEAQVERLEREMDVMNEQLEPLTSFVLPGGTALAAHLHLARTIARRAEATMVALAEREKINPAAMRYINRLSDHLFVMARTANKDGMGDVLWVPGENR